MVEGESLASFTPLANGQVLLEEYAESSTTHSKRTATLTEHVYTLGGEKNQPWGFLKVKSRTKDPRKTPVFAQDDEITGTVELVLEKSEHIEAVTVQVRGETWRVQKWSQEPDAPVPFWVHKTTLWSSKVNGGPVKLKGRYSWPFSITLPERVLQSSNPNNPGGFELPPCLFDKESPISIDYNIVATFVRGRFRTDSSLFTPIVYLPFARPTAPSPMRQMAYSEEYAAPGPQDDPEGWEILRPASVVGTLFDDREVEAACVFALAKPLSYTRGTFIPFTLTLACSESLALDLFAARGSLRIQLMRILHIKADATRKPKCPDRIISRPVGSGVYWPSSEKTLAATETRKLEGEIPIKSFLKPSFDFPVAALKYQVLFALTAPGFDSPVADAPAFTLSRDVTITSDFAFGPTPKSRANRFDIRGKRVARGEGVGV